MADLGQIILTTTTSLLEQLGISVSAAVDYDATNELYQVNLSCENPGVLIGHHGETLAAVQLLLGQHLKAQTGEWVNLAVNVNDYRQRREEILHQLADNTVDQVVASGQPHSLPPLPANERRVVHLHLATHPQVKTESMGEGRYRSVVISPK